MSYNTILCYATSYHTTRQNSLAYHIILYHTQHTIPYLHAVERHADLLWLGCILEHPRQLVRAATCTARKYVRVIIIIRL
jgi:hypothetical protein